MRIPAAVRPRGFGAQLQSRALCLFQTRRGNGAVTRRLGEGMEEEPPRDVRLTGNRAVPRGRPAASQSERILSGGVNWAGRSIAGPASADLPGLGLRGSGTVATSARPAVLDPRSEERRACLQSKAR